MTNPFKFVKWPTIESQINEGIFSYLESYLMEKYLSFNTKIFKQIVYPSDLKS